jgi:hypothetical protein
MAVELLGYYALNGNAADGSGNGNDGTLTVGAGYDTGKFGQAVLLNGSSEHVFIPHDEDVASRDVLSLCAWVYGHSGAFASRRAIYSNEVNGAGGTWTLEVSATAGIAVLTTGTYRLVTQNSVIADGGWHFVVFTKDGSDQHVYVDNVEGTYVTNAPSTFDDNATGSWIGSRRGAIQFWDGLIDEVRRYSGVLSEEERTNLYLYNSLTAPSGVDNGVIMLMGSD